MKWDVVFYSHLGKISPDIREWMVIRRWQTLWTVWVSGIPDKAYNDYHLHFPIHINPFLKEKISHWNFIDYMKWDWLFKWKDTRYILDHQWDIFEK